MMYTFRGSKTACSTSPNCRTNYQNSTKDTSATALLSLLARLALNLSLNATAYYPRLGLQRNNYNRVTTSRIYVIYIGSLPADPLMHIQSAKILLFFFYIVLRKKSSVQN